MTVERERGRKGQKTRRAVMRRDGGLCVLCREEGRYTPATEVDHITPLEFGGTNAMSNQQSLCSPHHREKTARDRGYRMPIRIGLDGWAE